MIEIKNATISLPPDATIGDKVHALRTALGISMSELARRSGISSRSISYYENNERVPGVDAIKRLSAAMEVTTSFFIDNDEFTRQENRDEFIARIKSEYGSKGAAQTKRLLDDTTALFAGGQLTEEEQNDFMDEMQELFVIAKKKAKAKRAGKSAKKIGEQE